MDNYTENFSISSMPLYSGGEVVIAKCNCPTFDCCDVYMTQHSLAVSTTSFKNPLPFAGIMKYVFERLEAAFDHEGTILS